MMAASQSLPSATIAVMGATGVGKSTFINLASKSDLTVGVGLESCTSNVEVSKPFELDGRIVTLVDTPGFDDTIKTEAEILRSIAEFLATIYEGGRKLNGVIFLHRISDYRMGGVARKNFRLFKKLCGDDALKSVVIATNMWNDVDPEIGASREKELSANDLFFKPALERGAKLVRHDNTEESAHNIIRHIMGFPPEPLSIQREIVDQHKTLGQTSAGLDLRAALEEQIQKQQEELRDIKTEMADIRQKKDMKHQEELNELNTSLLDVRKQLTTLEAEQNKLREESDSYRTVNEERTKQLVEALEERENELRIEQARSAKRKQTIQVLEENLNSTESQLRARAAEKEKAEAALRKVEEEHQREVARMREERERELEAARKEKELQESQPFLAQWANVQLRNPPPAGSTSIIHLVATAVHHFFKF